MKYQYNDGGRGEAGYKGDTGDCVTRAIAIATGLPYNDVRTGLMDGVKTFRLNSRAKHARKLRSSSVFSGVHREVYQKFLTDLGWTWKPTMKIGEGCKVHLTADELPKGNLIVRVSKHMVAVIDGVVHDNHDCRRDGKRCVYGYWFKEEGA